MATVNGGTIMVTLEGRDVSLGQLLSRIETQMKGGVSTARQYDTTMAQLSSTQSRVEASSLAYAQSLARGAAAAGDFAGAQRILISAIQQVTPNTTAASNAINQLQNTIDKSNTAATAQAGVFGKMSLSFNQLIGGYFAVTQAAQAFSAVISTGNALETQQALLRGLSGTTEAYEQNLAAARSQQERFGGSLAENIEGVAGFANLAKRTGIEISKLTDLARGLAVIDPAQGFKGAAIALKEFFSGDISSLARRFEIPRDELNAIKELGDESERLAALERVLAKFGITQELIEAQANTTAVAYERLGGAATDAVASIGQALATGLQPAAEATTKVLQDVAGSLNTLRTAGDQKIAFTEGFIAASESVEAFNARVLAANEQLRAGLTSTDTGFIGMVSGLDLVTNGLGALKAESLVFDTLTESEFRFAQGALAAGASIQTVDGAIKALKESINIVDTAFAQFPEILNASAQEVENFKTAALTMAATGEDGAAAANAIIQSVIAGEEPLQSATLRMQDYTFALIENAVQQQYMAEQAAAGAQSQQSNADAIIAANQALTNQAVEAINAAAASEQLKARQEEIYAAALAAAAGLGASGNAAAAMANQFGIAESAAANLINTLRNLDIAKNLANAKTPGESSFVGANALAGRTVNLEKFRQQTEALKGVNDAIRDQAFATADAAGKIRLLQNELSKLAPGTEAYIRKQTELLKAEDGLTKARSKGAKTRLSDNEKLHNQLATAEDKFNAQMEDAERKHQLKLLKILQEFAKKQRETEQENEILKRRSRFDFYSNLNTSQLNPIDRQAFAKAYEEAFAAAQQIAQSGKAQLAQEFLELRQQQIQELQELAQAAEEIKQGEGSDSDKDARLRELEERKKLLLDAQEEERKQLLEGGDANQRELDEKIASENEAYANQVDQIATNADRAADAKIAAAERAKKVVSEENRLYADQIALLDDIQRKNGGRPVGSPTVPSSTVPTGNAGVPAQPVAITTPVPIDTSNPVPVTTPEVQTVQQLSMFVVRDQGVIDALADQTARLEGKLDSVATTINNLGVTLGGKIDSLKNSQPRGSNLVSP